MRRAAAALAIACIATSLCAQNERRFAKDMDAVHELMDKREWQAALDGLQQALEKNQGKDYARLVAWEIAVDLEICKFHLQHRSRPLQESIGGKVEKLDRATGEIVIEYGPDDDEDQGLTERKEPPIRVAPLWFDDVIVTVRGNNYPNYSSGFRIGLAGLTDFVIIECGRTGDPAIAWRWHLIDTWEKARVEMARADSTFGAAKPYELRLVASATAMQVFNGDKLVIECPRSPEHTQVVFATSYFEHVRIAGTVRAQSLQDRDAAAFRADFTAFAEKFDARKELPGWLFEDLGVTPPTPQVGEHTPSLAGPDARTHAEALRLVQAGKAADALTAVDRAKGSKGREFRAWVRAQAYLQLGDPVAARRNIREFKRKHRGFVEGRMLEAVALEMLGKIDEAAEELEDIVDARPDHEPAYEVLMRTLLELGDYPKAREWFGIARSRGIALNRLAWFERYLIRALKGPVWDRIHRHSTDHYDVFTNMDLEVATWAGDLLEQGYARYVEEVAPPGRQRGERYRCYIFASRSGYMGYYGDMAETSASNSLGLFARGIRQLLIWNNSNREDMAGTIRHEGFHQYLHSVDFFVPTWLNEGMAEWYEAFEDGKQPTGVPARWQTHLDNLERHAADVMSFADLLHCSDNRFRRLGFFGYSQGWALVHFLKSDPARSELLAKLWKELKRGTFARMAIDDIFGGLDLAQMDRELKAHVKSLRAN